jgi:hypothetical protein
MINFKEYLDEGSRGLWDNIHAKRKRIKAGSGEKMRKPGSKGAPTDADFKAANEEVVVEGEAPLKHHTVRVSYHKEGDPHRRYEAIFKTTHSGGKEETEKRAKEAFAAKKKTVYNIVHEQLENEELSADEQFDLIEEVIEELALAEGLDSEFVWETLTLVTDEELLEYAIDKKGHKSSTGGLTQKGVDAYNAKTGGNLQTAVTTPPSKLKPGSKAANRRKSFCARMGGMEGAMKKPNGEPTRKALALRKWNC